MRKLLLSAAALSLLAMPAFAQGGGKAEFGRQSADQAQREQAVREHFQQNLGRPNPAPAPQQQQRQPDQRRDGNRGDGNRGNDTRRDDNRGGGWNNNNNRPGDYRRDNDRRDYGRNDYRGSRRDYSNFQYYHRSWNAPRRYRVEPYRRPSGWYARRWNYGDILPAAFWSATYWLSNYNAYALPPPPYGTVWVRYGDDALLIDRDSGEVISVQYGVFY